MHAHRAGTRIERTEDQVALLEAFIKKTIPEHDLELIVSEIGVNADWSAAYTPNSGPMDAVIKVQLKEHRTKSAQEYVHLVRTGVAKDPRFQDMDFGFDAGGLVRGAMNEGKSTPINIRVTGKDQRTARAIAEQIRTECVRSTALWTLGSSSVWITPSSSSTWTAPRRPTWDSPRRIS